MHEYTPDVWVVVEIKYNFGIIKKILAGWYGNFVGGVSWRLSSGIETIHLDNDIYVISNISGSLYRCHKNNYGTSGHTAAIYKSFVSEVGKNNARILPLEEIYVTPTRNV
jgi:hypothetical protein